VENALQKMLEREKENKISLEQMSTNTSANHKKFEEALQ